MGPTVRTAAFGLLAVLASSSSASAQTRPSIDARTWRPSTDPNASLVIEPAVTPGPGVLSVGAYAHYAFRPITLRRRGTDDIALRPLEHVVANDVVVNLGIGQRLALGAALPVIIYQDGDRVPPSVSELGQVPQSGFGDLGVSLKGAIIRNEGGGFGLAALSWVTLPTGDRASYMGEGAVTASARLLAEYTLLVAVAQASVGYKLRTVHRTWPEESAAGYRFGDELPWSAGLAIRPGILGLDSGNRQRWEVAFHGWLPVGPVGPFGTGRPGSAALSPALLAVSDRIEIGHYRDAYVLVGADFGLDSAVGVPAFRGIVSIGWAPREHDMDHDGVRDDVDGCPEIPEDRDGFEDADGCPEIDNDDDGIIDKEDGCPNVVGVSSADPKKNGCPGDETPPKPAAKDTDQDGIDDAVDKCPTQPEDKDGFDDEDGCPDPDNDKDGVSDRDDACPDVAGDPALKGCPNDDRDGDTYKNEFDKCPEQAETWNGVADEDGCPDEGGKPFVVFDDKRAVRVATAIKIAGAADAPEVDAASMPTLRAIATELNKHPDWTIAVGVRPGTGDPSAVQLDALARSFAVVRVLSTYSRRDGAAETVGWDAVKNQPGADSGIAFLVLVAPPSAAAPSAPPPPLPTKP